MVIGTDFGGHRPEPSQTVPRGPRLIERQEGVEKCLKMRTLFVTNSWTIYVS